MTASKASSRFPNHSGPRVWFITSSDSWLRVSVAREALAHGDFVVCGEQTTMSSTDGNDRHPELVSLVNQAESEGCLERLRIVRFDAKLPGQCQAAVARAIDSFGRVDILLCCSSEAVIGAVEELGVSEETSTLVRDQFETNFFGPVNIIKTVLPRMRMRGSGHLIVLGSITGHLGTPGLGMYCSSGWALEGFCDSLAYEVAPFNIKMTIIQANMEVNVLTNKITAAPALPQYAPENNPAPLCRTIIGGLLNRLENASGAARESGVRLQQTDLSQDKIVSLYPKLPATMKSAMLAETVNAIIAIAGHENPPARHIVGHEAVASVKEKLKTVSEELEDFVEVSSAVDIDRQDEGSPSAKSNGHQ